MFRRMVIGVVVLSVSSLYSVGGLRASDPFGVAQRAVMELYVKPLHPSRAQLKIDAEPFSPECFANAITIRVLVPTKSGHREVLKVDTVVIDDRLQFLGASGTALHKANHQAAGELMNGALAFLAQLNGWTLIDEPPRRGTKKGYVERRMREPKPRADYELDVRTIVFDATSGLPVLIGAPPSPTATNCGDR